MGLTFEALRPHLEAFAYLCEVIIAEWMFLCRFEPKEHRKLLSWAGLTLMFVLGTVTGIPQSSSLVRFLWYFLLMAWRVVCDMGCVQGGPSSVFAACMAGFATQHIANKLTLLFRLIPPVGQVLKRLPMLSIPLEVLVFATVYGIIYLVFAKQIRPGKSSRKLDVLSGAVTFLCIGVNRLVRDTAGESIAYEAAVCIYAIIGCVFALVIQVYISRWEEERSRALIIRRLLADSEKQYAQWENNVKQINIAIHDIKHMLDYTQALAEKRQVALPDLDAIRQIVDYHTVIRTGNDVLDVLLRNMTDLCEKNSITLNCTTYTDQLKSFDGMELYFLFLNAIDNAMRSAAMVEDPKKRIIDVSIRRFGDSVVIHIWNYYAGKLEFMDGLPVTRDNSRIHGFGMKSIQSTIERLDGVLNVRTEGQVFNLDIVLPLKNQGEVKPSCQQAGLC